MGYMTALICTNGHVINGSMEHFSEDNCEFCEDCGAITISSCQKCGKKIDGDDNYGVGYFHLENLPNYCNGCGNPFPWLEKKIIAAKEIAEEMDNLSSEEKEKLKSSIGDIIFDGPRTELASIRIKKILPKAGRELGSIMLEFLKDLASETAKKYIFGK